MPPRQSRGEAAAIKLLSSHPIDPPNMDSRFPVDFGRGHKKRCRGMAMTTTRQPDLTD
ncbi:hypothetical protein PVAP13_5KG474907 [Panicum virgatum]|uniref:Uncharacterized protein n=1 Tax=Panicum virgatum TaxID=38727 RepID=A0A8T0SVZ3_PANVG|nr:hypothetical protein PVAP13_5KG474907 [Panicum virgatum]